MTEQLQKKIDRAIKLLQSIKLKDGELIDVAYSGGKDSDVILQLAKEADIEFVAKYKMTTIDPAGTIKHCRENGVEVLKPQITFFKLIEKAGPPTRFRRFCCSKLKEYNAVEGTYVVMGVRRAESRARKQRYHEPVACRKSSNGVRINGVYPILDWTDEDVVAFIEDRKVQLHPLYYREDGSIDPKKRLGCICCPLQSKKKRIADFVAHPKFVAAYARSMVRYFEQNPNAKVMKYFDNPYDALMQAIFYPDGYTSWYEANVTMFGRTDSKQFLEDYFNIKL